MSAPSRHRLNAERDLFTGEFWAGLESVRLGLADGIAHPVPRLKALYGDKIRFEVHGMRRPLLRRLGLSADLLMDAPRIAPPSSGSAPAMMLRIVLLFLLVMVVVALLRGPGLRRFLKKFLGIDHRDR